MKTMYAETIWEDWEPVHFWTTPHETISRRGMIPLIVMTPAELEALKREYFEAGQNSVAAEDYAVRTWRTTFEDYEQKK